MTRLSETVPGARPPLPSVLRERVSSTRPEQVRGLAGAMAAVPVCLLLVARIGLNAPLGPEPPGLQLGYAVAETLAAVVPAMAAVAVGAVAESDWTIVGLVAAGSFALLASVSPVASVGAAGVVSAAALFLTIAAVIARGPRVSRELVFAVPVAAAVVGSLGATTGLLAPGVRTTGTTLAFLALVAAPAVVGGGHRSLLVGVVSALGVSGAAVVAPFGTGAALLAAVAAVDPPLVVAAAGIGGAGAVVTAGLGQGRTPVVAGGLLLLAAGVPATVPRGLAVVLGAYLLLAGRLVPADGTNRGETS